VICLSPVCGWMRWVLSESWQATISCFLHPCYKLPSIVFLADDTYGVPCRPYRGADFFLYARLQSLRYCRCSPKSTFLRRTLLCTSREVFLILCQKKRESINRFRVAIEVPRKPVHVVSATSRRRTSGSSTATEPTNLRLSHPRARGRLLNAVINYRHERH
jgi:hypothetical protein